MIFDSLTRILTPPSSPFEAPTKKDWVRTESELGELPSDYKWFLSTYGTGCIDGFLWVFNPAAANSNLNLLVQVEGQLAALRFLQTSRELKTYPLFPEEGGLLPIAVTDNGDVVHWLTGGKGNEWRIMVNAAREATYEEHGCGLTEFILKVLTREMTSTIFPSDFPTGSIAFTADRA